MGLGLILKREIKTSYYEKGKLIVFCATRGKKLIFLLGDQTSYSQNKCFLRVAHEFFPTGGSKNGFICPEGGNKMHFMTR